MDRFTITTDPITKEMIATDQSTGEAVARSKDIDDLHRQIRQYLGLSLDN